MKKNMPPTNADNVSKIHFHKIGNMLTSHRDMNSFLSA